MRFPRFRVFTWIILVINALFLIWVIGGVSSAGSQACPPTLSQEACLAAGQIGTGIGVALIVGLWVAADIILGILWLITRPRRRDCPTCGNSIRKGVTVCPECGTDFRQLYGAPSGGPVPN